MEFDEMRRMIRRPLPCLAISPKAIGDSALRMFWKALDVDRSSTVTVQEFMVFMRRRAAAQSIGKKRANSSITAIDIASLPLNINAPQLADCQADILQRALAKHSPQTLEAAYGRWKMS